jgi:hypothetical protein
MEVSGNSFLIALSQNVTRTPPKRPSGAGPAQTAWIGCSRRPGEVEGNETDRHIG